MLYLYLDESGDLGFDFVTKKPSEFFTICVLAVKGQANDRALANQETAKFNDYILNQIKALIDPLVPLDIIHISSQESYGLQATDIFAWGFLRKHEKNDREWHGVFKEKIRSERLY